MSDHLQPGEVEECGGGRIVYDPLLKKHGVYDASGQLHGYRGSLERARELAANIPSQSWMPAPPPEPSRSPRAMAPPPSTGISGGVTKDMLSMRDPPPRVVVAYGKSKAMTGRLQRR